MAMLFDAATYITDNESAAEYLSAALEDPNSDVFLAALADVARARGVAMVAEKSGLGRESLYKSLRSGSKLRFETTQKIVAALGLKLTIERA